MATTDIIRWMDFGSSQIIDQIGYHRELARIPIFTKGIFHVTIITVLNPLVKSNNVVHNSSLKSIQGSSQK